MCVTEQIPRGDIRRERHLPRNLLATTLDRQEIQVRVASGIGCADHRASGGQSRSRRRNDVRVHRARGVGRKPPRRLVAGSPRAIWPAQNLVVIDGETAHQVPAVLLEFADTSRRRKSLPCTGAGCARSAVVKAQGDALVVLARDEVNDATNRVCSVDRRCAVFQHFDPINRIHRDRVQVHRTAAQAVRGDASAIQQYEGTAWADTAKVRKVCAAKGFVAIAAKHGVVRDLIGIGRHVGGEHVDNLVDATETGLLNFFSGNDLQRQRAFITHSLDARTRHLNFGDLLRRCGLGGICRRRGGRLRECGSRDADQRYKLCDFL